VWDIALTVDGVDNTSSLTATPSTTEYTSTYYTDEPHYRTETNPSTASLIAESNADYLISGSDNAIDGVLLTYHALDTFYSCAGCEDIYEATLKSAKAALGERDLIVNHYATLYDDLELDGTSKINPATIPADSLMEEIYRDSEIADGVVMYSYPLGSGGRDDPKTGIFVQRENNASTTTFDVMMHMPWWQPWVMGWYQSWTAPALLSGERRQTKKFLGGRDVVHGDLDKDRHEHRTGKA
jgi:hypothetical protein